MSTIHLHQTTTSTADQFVWGGASGHTYTFTQRPDGKTDLDAVVEARNGGARKRAVS